MIMSDDILKIVLDKGLLAVLIVLAGWVFSRALERFKAGQAWATELARERLALYRRLVTESQSVMHHHVRFRASQIHGQKEEAVKAVADLMDARLRLGVAVNEAAVFFSIEVAQAFERISILTIELLDVPLEKASLSRESQQLTDLIRTAGDQLRALLQPSLETRALPPGKGRAA